MAKKKQKKRKETPTAVNVGISSAATETVGRTGSANAEYIKGYTGIDNETGRKLAKGLKGISKGEVHPDFAGNNIKQQAGYSAEVAATSRDNAEVIIKKSRKRTMRSDDHPQYGRNHMVVDRVQVLNGKIIAGSESQMKFVGDYKGLLNDIFEEGKNGNHKYARYRNVKLELPSEQVDKAREHCRKQAENFRQQAEGAARDGKPPEVVNKLRGNAERFQKAADSAQIVDSGLTTESAIFYRKHPKIATALDIGRTSHRAGLEGAKFGAAIGGAISIAMNVIAVCQDDKELKEALLDTAVDTGKAAAVGYGTAFAGSAVKGLMQQSTRATARTLSRTSLPAMVVTVCLELGTVVACYARGEIDWTEFLETIGGKGSGMLAGGLGATLGQIAVPVPIVGALIGSMAGYTISAMVYQDSLTAFKDAKEAHQTYLETKAYCEEARASMEAYRLRFRARFSEWLEQGRAELTDCVSRIDAAVEAGRIGEFAAAADALAACMGKSLQFADRDEFDGFMAADGELAL